MQALLMWLVVYAGLLALTGFVLLVGRGFTGRPRSNVALLRMAATIAFVLSLAAWLVLLLAE